MWILIAFKNKFFVLLKCLLKIFKEELVDQVLIVIIIFRIGKFRFVVFNTQVVCSYFTIINVIITKTMMKMFIISMHFWGYLHFKTE